MNEVGKIAALTAGAIILLSIIPGLSAVMAFVDELAQTGGLTTAVVSPVVKVAGISVITHTAAEVCKDAKEGGLAGMVETAGTVMALIAAMPLLAAVLSVLNGLI